MQAYYNWKTHMLVCVYYIYVCVGINANKSIFLKICLWKGVNWKKYYLNKESANVTMRYL